jgi:anti-sigma regulatory factor (Ser/Thr protein kinase)
MSGDRIRVKAGLDDLGLVRAFVERHAHAAGLSRDGAAELVLAVDEAVSNCVEHGLRGNGGEIEVRVEPQFDALRVIVRDDAMPFDPTRVTPAHLDLSPLDRARPGGFGLELMHRLVDGVDYRITVHGQNELTLLKRRR